jgi:hypothetical protein
MKIKLKKLITNPRSSPQSLGGFLLLPADAVKKSKTVSISALWYGVTKPLDL